MKLSDSAIGHIAKVLQVAILTGTDIIDNMRLMRFETEDGELFLDKTYSESFDANVNKMLDEATSTKTEMDSITFTDLDKNSVF